MGCHFIGCRWLFLAKKTLNWIRKLQSVAAKKHFSPVSRMDLKEAIKLQIHQNMQWTFAIVWIFTLGVMPWWIPPERLKLTTTHIAVGTVTLTVGFFVYQQIFKVFFQAKDNNFSKCFWNKAGQHGRQLVYQLLEWSYGIGNTTTNIIVFLVLKKCENIFNNLYIFIYIWCYKYVVGNCCSV